MEFPPFSATTTGEKASQTDGFQSIRRINRYPLRSRDKDAPLRLRVSIGVRNMGRPRIGACLRPRLPRRLGRHPRRGEAAAQAMGEGRRRAQAMVAEEVGGSGQADAQETSTESIVR